MSQNAQHYISASQVRQLLANSLNLSRSSVLVMDKGTKPGSSLNHPDGGRLARYEEMAVYDAGAGAVGFSA